MNYSELKPWRKALGLTQLQMAKMLGVCERTYTYAENDGKQLPYGSDKLADILYNDYMKEKEQHVIT